MIETRRLKNVVIFIQTILSFVLSRKIIKIYNDILRKYGNVTIKDFRKYEKLEYKKNKLKLDVDFPNNSKQFGSLSIQPRKIRKSEIFTTFKKIHRSFLNNLKSEETKSYIKVHLSYLANSCFYNYNLLHVYYVNIASYEKLKISL